MAPLSKVMRSPLSKHGEKVALGGKRCPEPGCILAHRTARLSFVRLLPTTIVRMVLVLTPFLRAASRYQTPLDTGARDSIGERLR